MDITELDKSLAEVQKKGFDDAFARFCADTFLSFSYSEENLAAARMHAHFLRLFIEERVTGRSLKEEIPESLYETYRKVSERSIRDTLSSEHPSGMGCCRAFVGRWCSLLSSRS